MKEKEEKGTSYKEMTKLLKPLIIEEKGKEVRVKPKIVVTIHYQNIQKSQLFIMPGATHFMLRSEHALFNQIVERFLNNPFKRPTTKAIIVGE